LALHLGTDPTIADTAVVVITAEGIVRTESTVVRMTFEFTTDYHCPCLNSFPLFDYRYTSCKGLFRDLICCFPLDFAVVSSDLGTYFPYLATG